MNEASDILWRNHLSALAEAEPPAALRGRVLAAWSPPRQAPGPARWWALAAAAALVAALGLPALLAPEANAPTAGADPLLVSQRLEQRLLDSPAAADPELQAGIAEIDRALGAAYRRGAAGEELDALWRARARALEQGLAAAPSLPARI